MYVKINESGEVLLVSDKAFEGGIDAKDADYQRLVNGGYKVGKGKVIEVTDWVMPVAKEVETVPFDSDKLAKLEKKIEMLEAKINKK